MPVAVASRPVVSMLTSADRHDDPLSRALRPPADESPDEREARLAAQRSAKERSRIIDERIAEDKRQYDKRKNGIKVLLLGQAESGKSTTLKNFQLTYMPSHFAAELSAWRTIIQLNLIRTVKTLLVVIQEELDAAAPPPGSSPPYSPGVQRGRASRSPSFGPASQTPSPTEPTLTDEHRRLRLRLSPLLSIEQTLTRKLLPAGMAVPAEDLLPFVGADADAAAANYDDDAVSLAGSIEAEVPSPPRRRKSTQELSVRAGSGWKSILARATAQPADDSAKRQANARDDPTAALAASKDAILRLWRDPTLQAVLKKRGLRLENMPGFFMDDVERIATLGYEPTESDILRARLRTLGVEEYRFQLETASEAGREWFVYDVGGSRTMRERWAPYFDDVHAIIFLAPLVFDQYLEEDRQVNRLEDSLLLWRQICGNKLLAKATMILFLNKTDVLARTLAAGVQVKHYVPRYTGPNEPAPVTAFFRKKFTDVHNRLSPSSRHYFVHETSVIDAKATRQILHGVRHGILTTNLRNVNLI